MGWLGSARHLFCDSFVSAGLCSPGNLAEGGALKVASHTSVVPWQGWMEWRSSRCGSWEREGKGSFGLRQWRHIYESCLIEMKVGVTWKIKIMAREFCCSI